MQDVSLLIGHIWIKRGCPLWCVCPGLCTWGLLLCPACWEDHFNPSRTINPLFRSLQPPADSPHPSLNPPLWELASSAWVQSSTWAAEHCSPFSLVPRTPNIVDGLTMTGSVMCKSEGSALYPPNERSESWKNAPMIKLRTLGKSLSNKEPSAWVPAMSDAAQSHQD